MIENNLPLPVGNHWAAVGVKSQDKSKFSAFIESIYPKANKSHIIDGCEFAIYNASEKLEIHLLADPANNFYSAYPVIKLNEQMSEKIALKLIAIKEWDIAYEAELICSYNGATISLFDTAYRANRKKYVVGNKYDFFLGAVAYKIEKVNWNIKNNNDKSVLRKGFSGLLPALKGTDEDRPEFVINGPILETEPTDSVEFGLNRFRVVACRPPSDDKPGLQEELRLDVFALDQVIIGEIPKIGDDLFALAWIQGRLA